MSKSNNKSKTTDTQPKAKRISEDGTQIIEDYPIENVPKSKQTYKSKLSKDELDLVEAIEQEAIEKIKYDEKKKQIPDVKLPKIKPHKPTKQDIDIVETTKMTKNKNKDELTETTNAMSKVKTANKVIEAETEEETMDAVNDEVGNTTLATTTETILETVETSEFVELASAGLITLGLSMFVR